MCLVKMNQEQTLFLGDLSCLCQESDVIRAFRKFGEILHIRLMRSKSDNHCLGYGFISFTHPAEAANALEEMNGKIFVGRKLTVNWGNKKPPSLSSKSHNSSGSVNSDTIHGAELQFSFLSKQTTFLVTEAVLRPIFEEFGCELQDISIKKTAFDDHGHQNGYGFVHFPLTKEGISAAIQASMVICSIQIEGVVYDCSFTHGFEKYLTTGGFEVFKGNGAALSAGSSPAPAGKSNHSKRK